MFILIYNLKSQKTHFMFEIHIKHHYIFYVENLFLF